MRRSHLLLLIALTFGPTVFAQPEATSSGCTRALKLNLANTTIVEARVVGSGEFVPPGPRPSDAAAAAYRTLPAFCRVEGVIRPSQDSEIAFEVWLPALDWNGKYLGIGNGGFGGTITYTAMADAVRAGYAASSTDTGHKAASTDGNWSQGHPEKLIDFGYRAIHETAVQSKAIIRGVFGRDATKSYFSSCSNGGRQALMEAQRFPEDYDGIIAGAPAYDFVRIGTGYIWNLQALEAKAGAYIPEKKLSAIESAALKACDALDGVTDGVIDDPRKCHFDPNAILCEAGDSDTCLTKPQVEALKKVYQGPRDSSGRQIYPGFFPGGETGSGSWRAWVVGAGPGTSNQYAFATGGLIGGNGDFAKFDFDEGPTRLGKDLAATLNVESADLEVFRKRGGKLIIYHGWNDPAIPPEGTIAYYESVTLKSKDAAGEFVRLYMVPGMLHCGGGVGPNFFSSFPTQERSPDRSMFSALEQWSEQGTAPASIIAERYNTPGNPASGVLRTRPLCPYPQSAKYKGTGSTDDATNFACRE